MKPNRFMLALAALCFAAGGASAQQTDGKSVAPKTYKAYMVSDAHLDTQWNWDVQTTIRETGRSPVLHIRHFAVHLFHLYYRQKEHGLPHPDMLGLPPL